MARIPVKVAGRALETGSVVQYPSGSPVADAVTNFGETIGTIAGEYQRQQESVEDFDANQRFEQMKIKANGQLPDIVANSPASGQGIHQSAMELFEKQSKEFIGGLPERLRPRFETLTQTAREQWANVTAEDELKQRSTWYRSNIDTSVQQSQNQVYNDPAQFEAARDQVFRAIDTSGLPQIEKDELRKKAESNISLALANREIAGAEADPSSVASAATRLGVAGAEGNAVDQVVNNIIGVESGGNANAKNPKSSASGLGQFIDSTWLATVKKYRPDIANGRSAAEILSLKTDAGLSREMTKAYTLENAEFLHNAGVQQTPGNIYLAHFLGPRGAVQVLKADKSASIASIVGNDVVNANSFLNGKSAADVVAWADRKMGGKTAAQPDPRYASLPLEQRLDIYSKMQAAAQRGNNAAAASQKAVQAQTNDNYRLRIATVDPNLTEREILTNPVLDDGQKASLITSFKSAAEEGLQVSQGLELLKAGALGNSVDPYDTKGKDLVDKIYDRSTPLISEDQRQPLAETIVQQTGVVPKSVLNNIRKGMTDTNVANIEAAAQAAQRISAINPAALSRREGGAEIQKRADDFNYFVNNLNLTSREAAQRIADMNNPDKQRDRKALEPAAKEFKKQLETENVAELFDESWLSDPTLGFSEGQALGIQAEYQAIAEDQFFQANGNPDVAKNRAKEEMKRLYGVTNLTGKSVVMKYPPDRYWPKNTASEGGVLGIGADPLGYAKTQLFSEIAGRDADFDPASVQFVTTPATEQMIKRGEMPGYSVFYTDANGVMQTFPGQLWRPDFKGPQAAIKANQEQRVEGAMEADQFQRERVIPGQDREQNLDNFLDGNPLSGQVEPSAGPPQTFAQPTPKTQQGKLSDKREKLMDDAERKGLISGGGGGY